MSNPVLFPDGWLPAPPPLGYFPGLRDPGTPPVGPLRDEDALAALLDRVRGVGVRRTTAGGPVEQATEPRGAGPWVHLRQLDFANAPVPRSLDYFVRSVRFELTATWRAPALDQAERQARVVSNALEQGITGAALGFCMPQLTRVGRGMLVGVAAPESRLKLLGSFAYQWDRAWGLAPPPPARPVDLAAEVDPVSILHARLLDYLRKCGRLAPWGATVAGWQGQPYPWFDPRHDWLPWVRIDPPAGALRWLYHDEHELRATFDVAAAVPLVPGYPAVASARFGALYADVLGALFPPQGDPDRADRDACFAGLALVRGGKGEAAAYPKPAPLGADPYGLIGTGQVQFTFEIPTG